MRDIGPENPVRVEVWRRDLSLPPAAPGASVLSRLREFEAEGGVDDVSVHVWDRAIPASGGGDVDRSHPVRRRVDEFRRWADRTGHSLAPAFRRSEQSTLVAEDASEVIRLPRQCLAVHEDDQLVGLFPCSTVDAPFTGLLVGVLENPMVYPRNPLCRFEVDEVQRRIIEDQSHAAHE